MKLLILYRPNSEHARLVEEYVQEFQRRHRETRVETANIDSRDGMATATLYDVVEYPAILALEDDGYAQKIWQGSNLPLMEEVASYATR
jgi:hypothetical protein